MFGPESGKYSWRSLPFLFEVARVATPEAKEGQPRGAARGQHLIDDFLSIFDNEGCKMVQMSCELHDHYAVCLLRIATFFNRVVGT